jgi:hypothetical protein
MQFSLDESNIRNIIDGLTGQSLLDVKTTINNSLNRSEHQTYSSALEKILSKKTLNRKDLKVLDKIDALTYEKHGMCLKDSKVTSARIKACKKYSMKFIDRDGLQEHMNFMFYLKQQKEGVNFYYVSEFA